MFSLPIAAVLSTAILSTSFISGILGMAGGMILLGILLVLPVPAAMILHGITQAAANGWRAWIWRAHVEWPIVGKYAAGMVSATLALSFVGIVTTTSVALVLLGLVSLIGLSIPPHRSLDIQKPGHAYWCALACTGLQLFAGVSGPLFDVWFNRSALGRKAIVATKGAIQALGHLGKVTYFSSLVGSEDGVSAPTVVIAIVFAIIGTQTSRFVLEALSDKQFRNWTRWLIAMISGAYLVCGTVLLLWPEISAFANPTTIQSPEETR